MSELQMATAATALALEKEKDELKRQLAMLSGAVSATTDKEREASAEVAACREEIDRWGSF